MFLCVSWFGGMDHTTRTRRKLLCLATVLFHKGEIVQTRRSRLMRVPSRAGFAVGCVCTSSLCSCVFLARLATQCTFLNRQIIAEPCYTCTSISCR